MVGEHRPGRGREQPATWTVPPSKETLHWDRAGAATFGLPARAAGRCLCGLSPVGVGVRRLSCKSSVTSRCTPVCWLRIQLRFPSWSDSIFPPCLPTCLSSLSWWSLVSSHYVRRVRAGPSPHQWPAVQRTCQGHTDPLVSRWVLIPAERQPSSPHYFLLKFGLSAPNLYSSKFRLSLLCFLISMGSLLGVVFTSQIKSGKN